MTSSVIALQKARSPARVLVVIPALTLLVACTGSEGASAGKVENHQTWAPDKLTSVQGVPATEIEALIQKKLDGPRLPRIDEDQWGHTKRLYKLYGSNPLWLTSSGLHETRTKA